MNNQYAQLVWQNLRKHEKIMWFFWEFLFYGLILMFSSLLFLRYWNHQNIKYVVIVLSSIGGLLISIGLCLLLVFLPFFNISKLLFDENYFNKHQQRLKKGYIPIANYKKNFFVKFVFSTLLYFILNFFDKLLKKDNGRKYSESQEKNLFVQKQQLINFNQSRIKSLERNLHIEMLFFCILFAFGIASIIITIYSLTIYGHNIFKELNQHRLFVLITLSIGLSSLGISGNFLTSSIFYLSKEWYLLLSLQQEINELTVDKFLEKMFELNPLYYSRIMSNKIKY